MDSFHHWPWWGESSSVGTKWSSGATFLIVNLLARLRNIQFHHSTHHDISHLGGYHRWLPTGLHWQSHLHENSHGIALTQIGLLLLYMWLFGSNVFMVIPNGISQIACITTQSPHGRLDTNRTGHVPMRFVSHHNQLHLSPVKKVLGVFGIATISIRIEAMGHTVGCKTSIDNGWVCFWSSVMPIPYWIKAK
jgi:hypothetical protein